MKLNVSTPEANKVYNLKEIHLTFFVETFRNYARMFFKNKRQRTYPKIGAGMRHVKHISGPGRGTSRQPRNRTLHMRTIHVPNSVGGRNAYHFKTQKTYLRTNKKVRKQLFSELLFKLLTQCNARFITENAITEQNKLKSFASLLKNQHHSYVKQKSKQSVILFVDTPKAYQLVSNIGCVLCFNLRNCQQLYRINIQDLDKKLVMFTMQSLNYILKQYALVNDIK